MVLLDLGFLVLHVERRDDAFGQDAGAEAAGRAARDASIEDQLHLIGTAEVEILADDFFEETAPGERTIEDLGQGELGLQDRELIPIARRAVRGGEGMRQSPEPFAKDRVDFGGVQGVGDPLHAGGRVARADAIVQAARTESPAASAAVSTTRAHSDRASRGTESRSRT